MLNDNGNPVGGASMEFMVWLSNLEELRLAYGQDFHRLALDTALGRLQGVGLSARLVEPKGSTMIATVSPAAADPAEAVERIGSAVGREPVLCGHQQAYLQVEVQALGAISMSGMSEMHGSSRSVSCRSRQPAARNLRPKWRQDYQDDMHLACRLLDDLRLGNLAVAFQPVAALQPAEPGRARPGPSLYYECLLRRSAAAGHDGYGLPDAVQALERLGLVERLDRSMLWMALDALAASEVLSLGCNVSARSFVSAAWWNELLAHMEEWPDVAQRLVVEITETSTFPDEKSAQGLIRHLQILGVRIALDDIGTQYGSLDILDRVRANIVKLDKSVLEKSSGGKPPLKMLQSMVGVCADRGVSVIVEGIASDLELDAALVSGASGAQGYLIAQPSMHLHGLFDHVLHVPDILLPTDADVCDWPDMLSWSRAGKQAATELRVA